MPQNPKLSRRKFLSHSLTQGAGLVGLSGVTLVPSRVLGANDRVRVAVVGVRGRGFDHVQGFSRLPNVEVAAICDVDQSILRQRLADIEKHGWPKPETYVDYRQLLENKTIDAVSIATPNHWHAMMGIWACQAGKDVYVEKPCSHNWWEGRQLTRAADKYARMVEHGTQSRSSAPVLEGIQKIQDGLIGNVYLARALVLSWRDTIGHAAVEPVPAGVDYDLWTGPAPMRPFTRNRFHYNWHWIWDTGNGEAGNQGVHQMDVARWALGVTFPHKVSAIGGHFMFDDDQQTPNVLNCAFEFRTPEGKRKMLELEVRHWISNHEAGIGESAQARDVATSGAPKTRSQVQRTIGNIFYGPKGYVAVDGSISYKACLGEEHEPGPSATDKLAEAQYIHFANFIKAVRSRRRSDLAAPIVEGHISCTLIHLANASHRLGRALNFDPATESVIGDEEANQLLRDASRGYRAPFVIPQEI